MSPDPDPPIVPRFLTGNAAPPPERAPAPGRSESPDEDDVRTVRPFVVTGGRTSAVKTFAPETQLVAIAEPEKYTFEKRDVLQMIQTPLSVAEVSAHLKLPLQAVSVLASDLVESGAVDISVGGSEIVDDPIAIRRLMDVVRAI